MSESLIEIIRVGHSGGVERGVQNEPLKREQKEEKIFESYVLSRGIIGEPDLKVNVISWGTYITIEFTRSNPDSQLLLDDINVFQSEGGLPHIKVADGVYKAEKRSDVYMFDYGKEHKLKVWCEDKPVDELRLIIK